ncbi:DNA-directed RNA polymerase V subunit 1 [Amaranthus tricolor]|uniref:DNA-directed RNA polymerase V subunit 1 n=1 Tax=Amaranthus tricolor TaxID=29722 RepID=UPI0025897A84|nr:DNA-directed RNA polymerase V subunit 1 [Amaranthus tricolor]XP_057520176.1 DNA-directed RNA polymerase V subunit 1 [Amaranthus tricolor]XP_057520177.1 DNA-directed RNA polymerase V subunit 1 [Amaranthus tricolor]
MDESESSNFPDAELIGIQFGLASHHEIRTSSISDCPISHASQLANPFLGLPLEMGKCESCGTAEPGKCEGHFGCIELPIPIYHPSHVSELKRILSLVCLKCLKMKSNKFPVKSNGVMEKLLSACCDEACHVIIKEGKNNDGAFFLELRIPSRSRAQEGCWNFLEKYGYRYGDGCVRPLLPSEVLVMLKKLPEDTKKKLAKKGYIPQDGFILSYIPVPPNCLSVPDVSDGISVMSSDLCSAMLKKVLRQIEVIRSSRSGEPNFESHEVEANELQVAVSQYLQVRGTGKAARNGDNRYGVNKEGNNSSSKAWVEKMRTLFISKGSGFSSRSVITGDAYRPVNEVGVPCEIAHKMTFEERVNVHNIEYLQSLVDNNLCLTFRDGLSTYSLREGSKGHTFLRLGQIVHRRIMDGDIVFINRPPTTHKHSLQALRVYIHDDHVVKINPLMCGPLAADFDGDCVHLFYPQSLSARAEVLELFSVEKQLLSSHSGNLNLQLATDSLLSLKSMFNVYFLDRASAQQLAMHASSLLPSPALLKASSSGLRWTAMQVLQTALPPDFECHGDRFLIRGSEILKLDLDRDIMASVISELLTSLFFNKSPKDALNLFDSLQPLLMENLFAEGFSVGLHDFFYPISELKNMQMEIQDLSSLLYQLRSSFNELVQLQFESDVRSLKVPIANFFLKYSALGNLIDSKSDSAIDKVLQQIGFLGLQLSDRRKFYSKSLVEEVASLFHQKYPFANTYPSEEFGFVRSCFFHGLDPYEEIVHSIATREVIVRSSKGLAEPGTLFKNLMAILRDVVICYDGTVRNISSNSVIQFEYGVGGMASEILFPAGEPVGVLAATAMSNPAYKAVLDSSPNSNSSWDMMKEILFCRTSFKNDLNDRRVILYLNDCCCGRKYCQENASCLVKNHLKKVSLRDAAVELCIEYKRPKFEPESCEVDMGLVGHIHLNAVLLKESGISMNDILLKCEEQVNLLRKKKKFGYHFKRILLSVSQCCFFKHSGSRWADMPCLKFFWQEQDLSGSQLERTKHIMADMICPVLLDTIIKGDPRISTVNIIWINPGTTTWVESPCNSRKGELAVEVTLEKEAVKQSGDAWRIVLDCCLPVFHLIDSTRSIPYAIKQIQDLFGISCAFDQAVQRLSTSVTKVTKGVLKEHLLLLASSMTCAGNLVGFNMSGIKALCRALSVQVPFTEATLYTPRKCFERASEKRHVDTLASIVGSCSWGKRVAIGTGAKFDVLWDTKESAMADKPTDVYNFLHLVSCSNEEEVDTGGLCEDILEEELALSPEPENVAVFDDPVELDPDSEIGADSAGKEWSATKTDTGSAEAPGWSSWGSKQSLSKPDVSTKDGGWDSGNGWGAKKADTDSGSAEGGNWSSWGSKQVKPLPEDSSKVDPPIGDETAGKGWNSTKTDTGTSKDSGWSSWGSKQSQSKADESTKDGGGLDSGNGWGAKKVNTDSGSAGGNSSWGSKQSQSKADASTQDVGLDSGNGWGAKKVTADSGSAGANSSSWGSKQSQWKADESTKDGGLDSGNRWGAKKVNADSGSAGGNWSSWGSKQSKPLPEDSFKAGVENDADSSGKGWNATKTDTVSAKAPGCLSWGSQQNHSKPGDSIKDGGWNTGDRSGAKKTDVDSGSVEDGGWSSWGSKQGKRLPEDSPKVGGKDGSKSWGGFNAEDSSPAWGQPVKDIATGGRSSWGAKPEDASGANGWGASKSWSGSTPKEPSSSWGKPVCENQQENVVGSPGGWGSGKASGEDGSQSWNPREKENKTQSSWGQPKFGNGSAGKVNEDRNSSSWGAPKQDNKPPTAWGQPKKDLPQPEDASHEDGANGWESKKVQQKNQSSWGQPSDSIAKNSSQNADNWGSNKSQSEDKLGWGSENSNTGNSNEKQDSWGQPDASPWGQPGGSGWNKKQNEGDRGWGSSNTGEWKSRKNRPPKQPGGQNDDSNPVAFTATRKRKDIFSDEEQDVLNELESIMQSIRRIMHQSGCNDGEPLPADDQTYVVDNVLNYHPDKAAKIGAGIDFITVKKHSNFQESRCFYVVSTDGQSTDFSYIKCLESFVKGKYPLVAESFTSKYFRKPRPQVNPSAPSPSPSSPSPATSSPSSPAPPSPQS